ncbi:MAG: bifunctional UDP-N-acetylglucosamine pyrophosphorylase / glucosamine-phosphate N-acetyltransferase [Solirubrobacterales bacterium]|nr:bifunctional UDP-N-acetylglucosamine pyrophosphorylase / glucosamine-phosphate N-acetyltransferase [Solirubrobacterales bacterium]
MAQGMTVLIMAAGEGTRMRSSTPKMLHPICGRAMIAWSVIAAREAGAERVCVIVSPGRELSEALPDGVETLVQPESDGTGGAIRAALDVVSESPNVVVLPGDHPLVAKDVIDRLLAAHQEAQAAATVLTTIMDDPGSYGRILRDEAGDVVRIIEAKTGAGDATPEQLEIREVNSSIYAFDGPALAAALGKLTNQNAQGEYYLGDVLTLIREAGGRVAAHVEDDPQVNLGVNDRAGLAVVEAAARAGIARRHMLAGVTIVDPASTWIDAAVEIAADARIEPGSWLRGATSVGPGAQVGPHSTLIDATVGAGASILRSHLVDCEVGDSAWVGPFAHLRPGTVVGANAKIGTFVEVKGSEIGEGAKVPHLSYIGDAEVGAGANVGAGTITANYDGFRKSRTKIGQGARISVNTSLVAPVDIGDGAYTGAGAVIREDVPDGALAVSKGEQRNIEGYAERKAAAQESEPEK